MPVVMTGLCRRCYTKKINRRVLDRLEEKFNPLTADNKFIFERYLESTRVRTVTDADVVLARKFAAYLSQNAIGPLTCWSEVLSTSQMVGLSYVRRPPSGCPILQVGRELERLAVIAPLREEKTITRSLQFKTLDTSIKPLVIEYFTEMTKTRTANYGLTLIGFINRWSAFLSEK